MRRMHRVGRRQHPASWARLAAVVVALGTGSAWAIPTYLDQIPARPDACLTCHTEVEGGVERGELNPFGEESLASLTPDGNDLAVNWGLIFNIDSDRDGQTNGQELGDPCGEWQGGAAPRTIDQSNPGIETARSVSPELGCTTDARPFDEPSPRIYDPGVGGPLFDTRGGGNFGCLVPMSQAPLPAQSVVSQLWWLWLAAGLKLVRRKRKLG